eukprot:362110-Chlamydomonas_euryale.AAC.10
MTEIAQMHATPAALSKMHMFANIDDSDSENESGDQPASKDTKEETEDDMTTEKIEGVVSQVRRGARGRRCGPCRNPPPGSC